MRTAAEAARARTLPRRTDPDARARAPHADDRGSTPRDAAPVRTGPASIGRAWEARGTTAGLAPAEVARTREVFVAHVLARLLHAGLVPAGTTLASPVSDATAARLTASPALLTEVPRTVGALVDALVGDVDADQRFDLDVLALERALPGVGTSQLLDALGAHLDEETTRALFEQLGVDPAGLAKVAPDAATDLAPPADLGLAGASELDRWRQQLALRADAILRDDGARPGELDPADHLELVSATTGAPLSVPVRNVPTELVEAFRYNLLTAQAAETYAASPSQIRFIDPAKGDEVNLSFWAVATAVTPAGRQTSWELRPGQSPAAAIDDCFGPNAALYATECAHGRTLVRLKGLLDYDRAVHGAGAGDLAFSARFAATPEGHAAAAEYLAGFDAARKDGATWPEWVAAHQPPHVEFALEISRHWVFGAGEVRSEPLVPFGGGAAAGTSGYFHNYGVSIQGVEAGWVGENVIDVGYRDGVHRWYGHPLGVHTEAELKEALASAQVQSMSELADYLLPRVTEESWKTTKPAVERLEARLTELRRRSPDDEEGLRELRRQLGALHLAHAVRSAFGDELTASGTTSVPSLLKALSSRPDDAALYSKLLAALKPAGLSRLARAYSRLDGDARESGRDALGLDDTSKAEVQAMIALHHALAPEGAVRASAVAELKGLAERRRAVADLEPGGRLASRKELQLWLRSDAFTTWYRAETGVDYAGSRAVSSLSIDELASLVERLLPAVRGRLTVHAETNGGDELLSHQMAELLKTGHAPEARYAPEPSVMPR